MPVNVVHIFEVGDYDEQIAQAARLLREGGVVVLPTETVYGAAGLLNRPKTVERMRSLRSADNRRSFTLHVARPQQAMDYLDEVRDLGKRMMRKLWPGPVALIFDVTPARQKEVAAATGTRETDLYDGGTITLRCPDHIVATDVLLQSPQPIALTLVERGNTSGNRTGFESVDGKVDLVFDGGPTRYSKPSTIVRVKNDGWEIVRAGIYDQRIIERMLRTTILFVCSGNTCRSPMAEAIARRVMAEQMDVPEDQLESKGVIVTSAGSFAMPGARATPQAVEAVKSFGADLSRHRSRPLSVELIHQADFIYVMSRSHLQAVTALVPSAVEKTVTLDPTGDIEDPIGGDASLYLDLAGTLKELIEKRLKEKVLQ